MQQGNVPPGGCLKDVDCSYGQSCASDVCNSGHCSHFMQEFCCGNFVCEAEEGVLPSCSDCGLLTIDTATCNTNSFAQLGEIKCHKNCWYGHAQLSSRGYHLFRNFHLTSDASFITLDTENIEMSAGSVLAFYVASTTRIKVGDQIYTPPNDGVVMLLGPSRYVWSAGGLFGDGHDDIAWWVCVPSWSNAMIVTSVISVSYQSSY